MGGKNEAMADVTCDEIKLNDTGTGTCLDAIIS
jgi:hypothetical protein